jgi:chromosome segregation protein
LGAWEREVQTQRARVDALDALDATGSGYFAGVRTVLQAANGHGSFHLDGIVGMVAKLVVAPAAQELAIETALGSHAQDVVVRRWADAEAAIAELKRRSAGRATFLPLDTLRANRPAEAPDGRGVVGVAAGLVEIDPGLRVVCDFLLGHTLVVDDLATARDVLRRCPGHWQIVTLEGDLARPSGTVTGGSAAASRGTLARFRELREARRALGHREADAHRLREAVVAARSDIARREAEHDGEDRAIRAAEDELRRAANQAAETQRQLAHVQQRRRWLVEELQRLAGQRDDAGRAADDAATTLTEVERDYGVVATAAQVSQEELAQIEHDAGARLGTLLDQRAERDLARQRLVVLDDALGQRQASRRRLADQLAAERERVIATRAQADATTARRQAAEDRRAILVDEQARRGACLAARRTVREQTGRALDGASQRLGQFESREREAREAIQAAERQLDRTAVELEGLRAQVTLELGPPDESALANGCLRVAADGAVLDAAIEAQPDPEKLRSRLDALRARLRALPPSTDVVTEYEATRARLAFLNGQSVDLQHSAETLRATIDETRETMRARFADTFTVVNAAFSRRFAALFGGGTARLVVDGGDEVAGVEVLAQPPGKRSQSLAALSGGERALTAAALLFALIEANPPPFCVLDEVDAALDESNVGRFCGALEELSQRTQFLVVTHNRQTMECARAIYGLTLEQRSESRVLSLRLPSKPSSA